MFTNNSLGGKSVTDWNIGILNNLKICEIFLLLQLLFV